MSLPTKHQSREPIGRILTFYSYKGGTGRSMTLANVSWILASNGYRVLVIDWDLEAPGLHRYFRPFLQDDELTETPGLIDFFVHFTEAARNQAVQGVDKSLTDRLWFYELAALIRYSVPLEYEFPEGGSLDFVAAGRQGPSYGGRVNSFRWGEFYEKLGGGIFLEAVKAQLRGHYDYVLIDSRTGLSDTSGICTVQMPDDLVVCFTLNRQSILGAAAIATSADAQRRLPTGEQGFRVWPVPSRVELHEKERLEAARLFAREKFAPFLWHVPAPNRSEYWGLIESLYFPYYAYEEILATIADPPQQLSSLLSCFERLVARVTNGEVKSMPRLPEADREALLARYKGTALKKTNLEAGPLRFFLSYSKADNLDALARSVGKLLDDQFGYNSAFWDERIPFGSDTERATDIALRNASIFILLCGASWGASQNSKKELRMALRSGKSVVPVLVGDVPTSILPAELRKTRSAHIGNDTQEQDTRAFVAELAEQFVNREAQMSLPPDPTDPQKGRWGGQSERGDRRLAASVSKGPGEWFTVHLSVESSSSVPLRGEVEFHLPPTFRPSVVRVQVKGGVATLVRNAYGAFTVGAFADDGRTKLELDLADSPQAPSTFRER